MAKRKTRSIKKPTTKFWLTHDDLNPLYSNAKSGTIRVEKWFVKELYDLAKKSKTKEKPGEVDAHRLRDTDGILRAIKQGDMERAQGLIDKAQDKWFSELNIQVQRESNRHAIVNSKHYETTLNFSPDDIQIIHKKAKNGELKVEKWFMRRLFSLANYHEERNQMKERQEKEVNAILEAVKSGDVERTQQLINETADVWYDRFDDGHKSIIDRTEFTKKRSGGKQ